MVGVAERGRPVAAGGGAAVVFELQGDSLGRGVEPAPAAEVEDLGGAAEDGGDDPGGAGQPAGLGGGEVSAGVQPGGTEPGEQLVQGDGDHDRGRAATLGGQPLGRDPFDQVAEGEPAGDRAGVPGLGGRVGGGLVEGEQHLVQHLSVQRRDPEPAVHGALVVLTHREAGASQRGGFLCLQDLAVDLVGDLGGDHLEDPPPQHGQLPRVVVGRQPDQVRLRGLRLLEA